MNALSEAYVSWSAIAEPADAASCWLVDLLGPEEALAWVRQAGADAGRARAALAMRAPAAMADAAVKASQKWVARLDMAAAGPHLERAAKAGVRVVTRGDLEWPEALDDLAPTAPFALWVRGGGHVASLWHRSVAVVGSRSSTSYGDHMAATISAGLCDHGWTVVSGGAYGIDGTAHRAALAVGAATIAVMAGGVDRLYPAGNADMLEAVLERGIVMSEVPPGFAPHRSRFLTRNRLIAAAGATVVVEAAYRSGALSTARHAAGLFRPVAAVPGPVTSASSSGCHALIRDAAATLVTSAADVLELAEPIGAPVLDERAGCGACDACEGRGACEGCGACEGRDACEGRGACEGREELHGGAGRPDFSTSQERQAYDAIGPRGATLEVIAHAAGLTRDEARVALGGLQLAGLARPRGPVWKKIAA